MSCLIAAAKRTDTLIAIVIIMSSKIKHKYIMYLNLHKFIIKGMESLSEHISFVQGKPCLSHLQQELCK